MAQHDMISARPEAYDVTSPDSGPIAAYLEVLGHRLRRRCDREDILAETADHLWIATDQLAASGMDPYDAEREAVQRFGRPELLARTWSTVPTGERPVLAAQAGVAGLLGVVSLVVFSLGYELVAMNAGWDPSLFHAWSAVAGVSLLLAGAPLLSLLADPARRAYGPAFLVGATLLALSVSWFLLGMGWFWPVPGVAFGITAGMAAWRRRESRPWLAVTALAWPLGTATYLVGDALNLGPMDRWYLHPVLPPIVGFWVAVSLTVLGVAAVSLRLRGHAATVSTPVAD